MSCSLGSLEIRDLSIVCILGELPRERVEPQEIWLQITAYYDFQPFLTQDDMAHAVDYVRICDVARQLARAGKFRLQETLAIRLADQLLEQFPPLVRVRVEVAKPLAVAQARSCGASVERTR